MATKRYKQSGNANQPHGSSRLLWLGLGAAVVLFAVVAFLVSRGRSIPFEMTGGEEKPLALLRNDTTVFYEFTYSGAEPAVLERIKPRIQLYQDQVLVADVTAVFIRLADREIELADGYLPEAEVLTLQPGDTFELGVVYLGQELGWNRIYGFRLQYSTEGQSIDGELELKDDYYIFVE